MGKIHILSTEISNKIAAGEVVERPASVVKELVENSIDAGADSICIEIKKGGIAYIRVTDNGSGMTSEDAQTAFLRHATSKIKTENDLDAIYTLGFRGEALSSIGAVSKAQLFTRTKDGEGILVECEGGQIRTSKNAGTPVGTTFVIQNLFYNTPARMKFLKKDSTESGYITDIISRFILAHPEISFKLIDNGKDKLFSPGDGNLVNAVYTVYGRDYAKAVLPVEYSTDIISVKGVTGKGDVSRPNRNFQSYFVNGRYIKSPLIIRAVEEAYKNQIMIGKFPMSVLDIKINPSLIDINVHPTKLEVKFSNEKAVYEAVYFAVKNALYTTVNIPKVERTPENDTSAPFSQAPIQPSIQQSAQSEQSANTVISNVTNTDTKPKSVTSTDIQSVTVSDTLQSLPKNQAATSEPIHKTEPLHIQYKVEHNSEYSEDSAPKKEDTVPPTPEDYFEKLKQSVFSGKMPSVEAHQPTTEINLTQQSLFDEDNTADTQKQEPYTIIGQLFSTYILVQRNDELLICDQHAAHERIKYEQLLKQIENSAVASQILISPSVVKLSPTEYATVFENIDFFTSAGFEIDEFGMNTVAVRSLPSVLSDGNVADIILEMVTSLSQSKREIITERRQRAIYSASCKAAVKANHSMSIQEMKTLLDDVFALENINTCPHGRPIIISMTKKEIEKEFKRII